MTTEKRAAAVFFDRDGTLMRDVDYCGDPKDVEIFAGVGEALKQLKASGFKLFIITNQSGIGRGYFSETAYRKVEQEVDRQIGPGVIDGTYFCPHAPDQDCVCRKPSREMVERAARDHGLDLSRSYFIGDKNSDIQCGKGAGVKTILVQTGYGHSQDQASADFTAADVRSAVQIILTRL